MTYKLTTSNGQTETFDTLDAAEERARELGAEEIGHDGDLRNGGDRTLCWEDEVSAENDDGQRALCSISRVGGAK